MNILQNRTLNVTIDNSIFMIRTLYKIYLYLSSLDLPSSEGDQKKLWLPSIRFEHKEEVMETWEPSVTVSKMTPTREAKLSNGLDMLTVSEIYEGESNPINLFLTQRIKFLCSFVESMKNYPFKEQNCSFYIYIDKPDNLLTDLTQAQLYDEGPKEFGQFVLHWEMSSTVTQKMKGVEVKLNLRRNIQSIFLVTYLPTILMNMINQATSYITATNKYDVIYMVNM